MSTYIAFATRGPLPYMDELLPYKADPKPISSIRMLCQHIDVFDTAWFIHILRIGGDSIPRPDVVELALRKIDPNGVVVAKYSGGNRDEFVSYVMQHANVPPGSLWHHVEGGTYRFERINNLRSGRSTFKPTITYFAMSDDEPYARKAEDWFARMRYQRGIMPQTIRTAPVIKSFEIIDPVRMP